jgi:UDP-perosamine 4-acetyltransferase
MNDPLSKPPTPANSPFIIFGAGGHAKVVIEVARSAALLPSLVLDDNPHSSSLLGVPVTKSAGFNWKPVRGFRFLVAIGSNRIREKIFNDLLAKGGTPQTIIHPFTSISPTAFIGNGTVVFAGVIVNANSRIAENCILNTGCRLDHDANIGPHTHLCPASTLAGTVTIGARTMIGTGACCIPGILIGDDCTIGAGSVVIRNIPDSSKAYGNPARIVPHPDK